MADSLRYRLTITTLTPLHVGSGQRLREGYDFIAHDDRLWVADHAALYEAMLDEAMKPPPFSEKPLTAMEAALLKAGLAGAPAPMRVDLAGAAANLAGLTLQQYRDKGWLHPNHFAPARGLFRYSLPGSTFTTNKEGELHEHIKDVHSRPYLPGSSLKGALRTVVLRTLAAADARPPVLASRAPKFAARDMEQRHFAPTPPHPSRTPNYDVWRALHVADSAPFDPSALAVAQVYVRRFAARAVRGAAGESGDIPIDVEAVRSGATTAASIVVDAWLFDDTRAAEQLKFPAEMRAIFTETLCQTANADALALLDDELAYVAAVAPSAVTVALAAWLKQMRARVAQAGADEMFIRSGRSTGWLNKTLGHVLQEKLSESDFDSMVQRFRLGRRPVARPDERPLWRKDRPIPTTRQLAAMPGETDVPMGWLHIRMEKEP